MFLNYLKIALRNLFRYKVYTATNIFGLSSGIAICLCVIGYIGYEFTFEDPHVNKDRIYRLNTDYASVDQEENWAYAMPPLRNLVVDEIPEVENATIFRQLGNVDLAVGEGSFVENREASYSIIHHGSNVLCADQEFLKIFSFPLVQGDPETVLRDPNSVVISEKAAEVFFHGEDPMGKNIWINESMLCQITGVMKDNPDNTQLHSEFLVSYSTLMSDNPDLFNSWNLNNDYVYLLLAEGANPQAIEARFPAILERNLPAEEAASYKLSTESLNNTYFGLLSFRWGNLTPMGEFEVSVIFSVLAGLVLLLAVTNFVNLSTARSAERVKEVGIRKVVGAFRGSLIKQFLGESLVITLISVAIGLLLYEVFKVIITPYLPREMFVNYYSNPIILLVIAGMTLLIAFGAGFYPAIYISKFKPIMILHGRASIKSTKSLLRKGLVILQFTIAIAFVVSALIIVRQFSFLQSMELGFDKENILLLDFHGDNPEDKCNLMRNEAENMKGVISATVTNAPPGRDAHTNTRLYTTPERIAEETLVAKAYRCDFDFFETFNLSMKNGQQFSEERPSDIGRAVIVNQAAAEVFGTEDLIGQKFYGRESEYEIIGVVNDFIGSTMNYSFKPITIMFLKPDQSRTLALKISEKNVPATIAELEAKWSELFPHNAFKYSFLDEEIDNAQTKDSEILKIFIGLSAITISIACLGLFALVALSASQRTKEIGIRKVLGASVKSILYLLGKEFIVLILIANVFAWISGRLFLTGFLQGFPFQAPMTVGVFLLPAILALALAALTASYHAIKAATSNPVDALKHE
jgi:putative ABC transport system permease protein